MCCILLYQTYSSIRLLQLLHSRADASSLWLPANLAMHSRLPHLGAPEAGQQAKASRAAPPTSGKHWRTHYVGRARTTSICASLSTACAGWHPMPAHTYCLCSEKQSVAVTTSTEWIAPFQSKRPGENSR